MSTFRVLQFNMQFGQGWLESDPDRGPVDLDRTIEAISAQQADIILLQEVERAAEGGVQANPPPNYERLNAALGAHQGLFTYPKADPRELPFGIGLAIFSKQPIYQTVRRDLPSPRISFEFRGKRTTPTDRVMLGARTAVLGRDLHVFNTHLLAFFMLGASSSQHPQQVDILREELLKVKGPALIGGDFNVSRHSALVDSMAQIGFTTAQTRETTWRRRPFVLDHLFYNPLLACSACRVVPTPVSDHHMLVADFAFRD